MIGEITFNLATFAAVIGGLSIIMCGAALLKLRPTRSCHLCGARVLVEARRCRTCGYKFTRERGVV